MGAAEQLRAAGVSGVIGPTHPEYDRARRVWNGDVDRRPALIVQCLGTADVIAAVGVALESRQSIAIRGGGHSAAGYSTCDGGIVIDLSPMTGIWVAPERTRVVAQAGVLWSDLDRETQVFGMATPGGMVSSTGIAGLTLGGGLGWLMGKHGLTVDNVLGLNLVGTSGEVLRADANTNPDLFWALRGGGGNFGVVTSFEYRLHPVAEVFGGLVAFPLGQGREVLRCYRELSAELPDAAEAHAALLTLPGVGPSIALLVCYNGSPAEGERFFRGLRRFGTPSVTALQPLSHVARQRMLDDPYAQHGRHRYWKSGSCNALSDEFIDVLLEAGRTLPTVESAVLLFRLHGAAARVPVSDTACALRGARWDFNVIAQWAQPGESEQHREWPRRIWKQLQGFAGAEAYINHLSADDGSERVRASFGQNFERLAGIKRRYDPENRFCLNPNIHPW